MLRELLPKTGRILEIASGSGEHAVSFAAAFPDMIWQPSDADPDSIASIAAWSAEAHLPNLQAALPLDVRTSPWPDIEPYGVDGVVSINMIHIAPWESCQGLMKGGSHVLKDTGFLLIYGPFTQEGRHTSPSNALFDDHLKELDPLFGIRDVADVSAEGATHGLILERQISMPANNLSLIFRKQRSVSA